MDMAFVSEFDLLRQSHSTADILREPWMVPANRATANRLFKIMRAREEIHRLNIEIRRLRTYMHVEETTYLDAIAQLEADGNLALASEIQSRYLLRHEVHIAINHHLDRTTALKGYSGSKETGVPLGWSKEQVEHALGNVWMDVDVGGEDHADEVEDIVSEDEHVREGVVVIEEIMSNGLEG